MAKSKSVSSIRSHTIKLSNATKCDKFVQSFCQEVLKMHSYTERAIGAQTCSPMASSDKNRNDLTPLTNK